jgi:hypothetical protein
LKDERLKGKAEDLHASYTLSVCPGNPEDVVFEVKNCVQRFIIRVKRELQRVYRNGCRYNERLNAETGGSKRPRTHWVARVNIVREARFIKNP